MFRKVKTHVLARLLLSGAACPAAEGRVPARTPGGLEGNAEVHTLLQEDAQLQMREVIRS